MRFIKPLSVVLSVAGLFWAGVWFSVVAQGSGQITIDPFYQEITVDPKEAPKNYSVKITNNSDQPRKFSIKTADFGSLNETGGVAFIGVAKPDLNYRYGLTPWLKINQESINVAPGQTKKISFRINKLESLTPGGHYGAILVTQNTGSQTDESKVKISPVVSSLILLKKIGGESYGIELDSANFKHSLTGLPSKVNIRMINTGNVHIVPRGTVSLTDSRGAVISDGLINPDSGFILPASARRLQTELKEVKVGWLPGYYNLDVKFRYDGKDDFAVQGYRFFYVGRAGKLLAILIVVLTLVWLASTRKKLVKFGRKG